MACFNIYFDGMDILEKAQSGLNFNKTEFVSLINEKTCCSSYGRRH